MCRAASGYRNENHTNQTSRQKQPSSDYILAILLVVCRPLEICLPATHLISYDPHRKALPLLTFCVGCRVLALHPLVGARHKIASFSIHAGCVYTICILFLLFYCRMFWQIDCHYFVPHNKLLLIDISVLRHARHC